MEQNNYTPAQPPVAPNPGASKAPAIVGLVFGIVSICSFYIPFWNIIGLVLGIVGLVLSLKARKEAPNGLSTAGLICSIIGLVLCAIGFFSCTICSICTCISGAAVDTIDWSQFN